MRLFRLSPECETWPKTRSRVREMILCIRYALCDHEEEETWKKEKSLTEWYPKD